MEAGMTPELGFNLIHRFNVGDALRRAAVRRRTNRAAHFEGRDLTYWDLDELTNRVARLLMGKGIGRGDSVAILAANSPEYVAAFFGCARIGARLVPINLMFTADDVDYVLRKTHAKALLLDPAFAAKVNFRPSIVCDLDDSFNQKLAGLDASAVEEYVENEDAVVIIFTSGTTARPKGVALTHLNWYANLIGGIADLKFGSDFRYVLALPMFHVGGLMMLWACIALGCDSVILRYPRPAPILD